MAAKRTVSAAASAAKKSKISGAARPKKSATADIKTKPNEVSVDAFIAKVPNDARRKDAEAALKLMKNATGLQPKMWGPSIIGFGSYRYKYESGREGDMCMTGFSPRAAATVFYVIGGVSEDDALYTRLGKHKLGKSCLYINRLADVDLGVLEKIIAKSVAYMKKKYPTAK